ncbi:importin alpha subunit [Arabidopsis thaliana]|uniref:Importin subunit alpha-8 n=1 Tax=Arabidopsis thaliana TaxID=3702 RepID=IMPA8_ARATH|nr:importin alpha isoform 8 [Arabidopsis thaliana]Q9FJ92.1 RecName: Full=Importin subunit alpha-8; Short=IMPa-8 [Arabidopsis thaliana]AED96157.1 importin alpha isoform 8 [Arabidopsis thaliana]BAB11048.1 importin alpha subunit [Arabidopsis thaliana]|eukprot:NP_200013.1 importin alpha isoform 8 [Arabidopsis thaliana]
MAWKTEVNEVSDDIIDGLWSDDPPLQLESVTKIRRITSQRDISCVIRSGVVPRLVQLLKNQVFPKLQYEVAWALTNIAVDNPGVVVNNNAVPVLIQLIASPKDYVREQAIWTLSNVAGHSIHYRDFVLNSGVLMPLLRLLYKDTTLRIATWALRNLCRGKPHPAFDQVKPALPALEILLHSHDEDVLKNACMALCHLSEGSEDGIQSVIEAGFVPKLVQILQLPSPVVLVPALLTIGAMTAGNHQQTQCVINSGALPIISNMLTRNHENKIKKCACWVISNITAGTKEQIQSVIDANLIPILVNLAQDTDFYMKKEAVWAISNMALNGSHDQIKYMAEQSCIKQLCDILVYSDERTTILKCLDGLENMLKAGEAEKNSEDVNPYCLLIEDAEGLEKISKLQMNKNDDIYEKAYKILVTNWFEEDDENNNNNVRCDDVDFQV